MRYIFIDCRVSNSVQQKLLNFCDRVICVPEYRSFDRAVAAHADMNILKINDKIFTNFDLPPEIEIKYSITRIWDKTDNLKYPHDVYLNAAVIGDRFVCKVSSILTDAIEYARSSSYRILNVKQGYSKCNIAVIDEKYRAIVTEDRGIYDTLVKKNFDVLLLNSHGVKLDPYQYGFIGGACGMIEDKIFFFGNLEYHNESERIVEFCNKYKKKIICLSDNPLYDYGGLVSIDF